jgi:hypothetical protein
MYSERARLTATLSGTDYYDVLVVAFDDWGGGGAVPSPLHILIVIKVTSDYPSDDGATTIRRLTDRIDLLRCNVGVAFAVGVDNGSCSARGVGPVCTAI